MRMPSKERGWIYLMQKDSDSSNSSFLNCMEDTPPLGPASTAVKVLTISFMAFTVPLWIMRSPSNLWIQDLLQDHNISYSVEKVIQFPHYLIDSILFQQVALLLD